MANIILRPDWYIPEAQVTPELVFFNRRHFLRQMGIAGAGLLSARMALSGLQAAEAEAKAAVKSTKYPAKRNPDFNPDLKLTDATVAGTYNNFYEFSVVKDRVHRLTDKFVVSPWPIRIDGLVDKPMTVDIQALVDEMTLEERVYRFRCVEGWSMVVPWTGFPLSKLIEKVAPKASAKFVRFETFNRPEQAPGMADDRYPWPYFEGLRMDEAMHPLTMVVTGIYGKPMPKQHGAPVRIVVPWKYGYKSIKSIVHIQFVDKQPTTFWEQLQPQEYPFESNVDPSVPHPRWSQATERVIDTNDRIRTKLYNGYAEQVASLYPKRG